MFQIFELLAKKFLTFLHFSLAVFLVPFSSAKIGIALLE